MDIIIRKALIEDLEIIATLVNNSVKELQKDDYDSNTINQALELVSGLDTLVINGRLQVAEYDGLIVGCGGYSLIPKMSYKAELKSYFVLPEYARKGISTKLLNHSIEQCIKVGVTQFCLSATLTGVPFYKRNGFTPIHEFDHKLSNGNTFRLVEMQRNLVPE